jgi:hypothetical protein
VPAAEDPSTPAPSGSPREARLRPEHAALYPGVPAGLWIPAATLAQQLLSGMVSRTRTPARIDARLMDDAHFEFRGGERSTRPRRDSRATDAQ